MNIAAISKNLLNLIYPLHCASCGRPLDPLDKRAACENCLARITRNPRPYCRRCGRSVNGMSRICADCRVRRPRFDRAYSACLYEGALKEFIHRFKYDSALSLACVLSNIMAGYIAQNPETVDGIDILTYVPLGNNRLRQRGYNQSRILADNLSRKIGIPVWHVLVKSVPTRRQNELSREERLVNVEGAFAIRSGVDVEGLRILLIDDVMTTGATLSECARALKDAGAESVRCLTLARGL